MFVLGAPRLPNAPSSKTVLITARRLVDAFLVRFDSIRSFLRVATHHRDRRHHLFKAARSVDPSTRTQGQDHSRVLVLQELSNTVAFQTTSVEVLVSAFPLPFRPRTTFATSKLIWHNSLDNGKDKINVPLASPREN